MQNFFPGSLLTATSRLIYNKIKKAFEIDAKQELQEKQKQEEEKEPLTIFGIHWALVIFLFPVAILMILFDDLK